MQMILGVCKYRNSTNSAMSMVKRPIEGPTPVTPWRHDLLNPAPIQANRHNYLNGELAILSIIRGSGTDLRVRGKFVANMTRLEVDPSIFTGTMVAVFVSIIMIFLVGVGLALY